KSRTRSPSCRATQVTSRAKTRSSSASSSLQIPNSRGERQPVPEQEERGAHDRGEGRRPRAVEKEVGDYNTAHVIATARLKRPEMVSAFEMTSMRSLSC